MRRIALIAIAAAAGVLLLGVLAAVLIGRSMVAEPGVERLTGVREDLGAERLLFVFAHPDDEITANALTRRAVEEGLHVALFTATRGEAGTQYPPVVDQAHLGVVREGEARKHGFAIGVDRHVVEDLGDGRLAARDFEDLVARVLAEIEAAEPDILVSFHPESAISLHPDHMTIGRAAREAVARSGREIGLVYVLAPRPALTRFGGENGARIAALQPEPDFAVPAPARDKRRAWAIHESQSEYLQAVYGMPPWLMYALWTREYYAFADEGREGLR